MTDQIQEATAIWNQKRVPVVYLPATGPIRARIPYAEGNKSWLRADRRNRPKWNPTSKYWTLPRAWFDDFVTRTIERFGRVYVIQPYREMEKCARACWEAKGFQCDCSCMGGNHGSQSSEGWREITETFAVRWQDTRLGCRLIGKAGL